MRGSTGALGGNKSKWARLASRAKDGNEDGGTAAIQYLAHMLSSGGSTDDDQLPFPEMLPDFVGMKFLERDGTDDNGTGTDSGVLIHHHERTLFSFHAPLSPPLSMIDQLYTPLPRIIKHRIAFLMLHSHRFFFFSTASLLLLLLFEMFIKTISFCFVRHARSRRPTANVAWFRDPPRD